MLGATSEISYTHHFLLMGPHRYCSPTRPDVSRRADDAMRCDAMQSQSSVVAACVGQYDKLPNSTATWPAEFRKIFQRV